MFGEPVGFRKNGEQPRAENKPGTPTSWEKSYEYRTPVTAKFSWSILELLNVNRRTRDTDGHFHEQYLHSCRVQQIRLGRLNLDGLYPILPGLSQRQPQNVAVSTSEGR